MGDFRGLLVGEGIIIYLFPVGASKAIILGALSDEEVEIFKLLWRGAGLYEWVDNLADKLVEFLAGNGADFEMV